MSVAALAAHDQSAFRHEALLYEDHGGFVDATTAFVRDGLAQDAAVLVVLAPHKIALLRDGLADDARQVQFADMGEIGRNPARIIPAWWQFVTEHGAAGRPLRGIGEPIDAAREPAALAEAQLHEALLNTAFSQGRGWWLLCPYDTAALAPDVIKEARRTHPHVWDGGIQEKSADYGDAGMEALGGALPEPPPDATALAFSDLHLESLRGFVSGFALESGLAWPRVHDLVLAVHEVTANSVRHGGGGGMLTTWRDGDTVLCEVRDRGVITDPLVGRLPPPLDRRGGRGVWLANQLCDLVQVRAQADSTTVRLHMRIP